MYSARDRVDNEEWLAELQTAADRLDLDADARSYAVDLFLSSVPESERSKKPAMAASLYAGALIASDGRSQTEVADAAGVSRLSIQQRWKDVLESAGLEPPSW
ncbi:transcription initiation factor IIB family protein [Haloarchaeobius sp. HME9146]|uniref:transcription initiation factor IIB family protein n=1 Tax=unclassified Haloarchaeobius TaxID=2614452 RepID=UPI0021C0CBE1|nr:transcription initiation factor IIB family protein [Haloarchaeobius sp. HME9146]MCT9096876.1 transcription initiation factor IIB family protein [Haloarchaeobius sp. HME9146]